MTSDSDIDIRPPTRQELRAVSLLAAELARQHHDYDPQRFMLVEPVAEGYEGFFASELRNRRAVLLAAFDAGEVVGYAYGRLESRDWNLLLDKHGALHDLYVAPTARRRGIARRLALEALGRLEALGAPRIVLYSAWQNSEAQRFFESLGFRKTMVEMTREHGGSIACQA